MDTRIRDDKSRRRDQSGDEGPRQDSRIPRDCLSSAYKGPLDPPASAAGDQWSWQPLAARAKGSRVGVEGSRKE